ncbi:MAG: hypothetical protein C0407_13765 [Desulfobacca sp.]|nr:hypothetical protein [Desulfobacca sp.]
MGYYRIGREWGSRGKRNLKPNEPFTALPVESLKNQVAEELNLCYRNPICHPKKKLERSPDFDNPLDTLISILF